jgi:hypothetical protein
MEDFEEDCVIILTPETRRRVELCLASYQLKHQRHLEKMAKKKS